MPVELGPARIEPGGELGKGVWHGHPFTDGVGRHVISEFGAWEQFRKDLGWGPHQGIDIGETPIGTPVHALGDCTISFAGRSTVFPSAGKYVRMEFEDGVDLAYAHLSQIAVSVGDDVQRGDLIGHSGDTSDVATVPHLHIGVRKNNREVDPLMFMANHPGDPRLDKETAEEWYVSQYFLGDASHKGTKAQGDPEFLGLDDDGKTERWEIRLLRPLIERPQ